MTRPLIRKQSEGKENTKETVRGLFTIPMIFSAALLSFAHGANDVANAVGPLAAIVSQSRGRRCVGQSFDPDLGDGCGCVWPVVRPVVCLAQN